MKTYELITGEYLDTIKATLEDGTQLHIPTDPANSDYAEYLAFTAWVEAGNDPDEFWVSDNL
jgi:hypothetical protein